MTSAAEVEEAEGGDKNNGFHHINNLEDDVIHHPHLKAHHLRL